MSLCNTALETQSIPTCLGLLTVGTIPDLNQDVHVVIEDITTGRKELFDATSTGAGVVIIDLTEIQYAESHTYQAWIFKDGNGIDERYAVTVSGASATTEFIKLSFEAIMDDGVLLAVATTTLKAA